MTSDLRTAPSDASGSRVRKNVEDVLPLLANQHVLVLFSGRPGDEDPGFLQVRVTLTGALDVRRFEQAWTTVVQLHPALRASIHEREGGPPLAVVRRAVTVPFEVLDWRARDGEERTAALTSWLEEDRRRGLDFSVPPVMRLAVIRMSDTSAEVVWTCHHILLDGWSSAIVLEDLMKAYHALGEGSARWAPQEQGRALRAYVQWATGRESGSTREYWRGRLQGFAGAEPLYVDVEPAHVAPDIASQVLDLPDALTRRVQQLAGLANVTPSTVIMACWSLVAGLLSDDLAPVFGTTVSGRTAPIDGVDRLVGYLSNAVPVRIVAQRDLPITQWLQKVRDQQFEMQPHEHASLDDIARWCGVPGHRRLFETFLIVENFPLPDTDATDLQLTGFRSGLTSSSPVTVAVGMDEPWVIHLRYDTRRLSDRGARAITDQFLATLEAVTEQPDRTVAEVRRAAGDCVGPLVVRVGDDRCDLIAPRTPTEQVLTEIWASLLDRSDIGVGDDWFAIGGSSLAAVSLFGAISDRFGVDLPLNTLLAHPTIESLGRVLDGPSPPAGEQRCLVAIHTDGTRVPLIGIHGGRGGVLHYRALWEQLGPDQPMYAIEPIGLDGVTDPLDSVPAMAARYVGELREVQPSGPYRLIGYCFGGAVALEMASMLEEAGEQVDLVAVIDGSLPLHPARAQSPVARAVAVYRKRGALGVLHKARGRITDRRRPPPAGSLDGKGRRFAAHDAVRRGIRHAFATYEPKHIAAPIVLVLSSRHQAVGEGHDWHLGWGEYTPSFKVVAVDGRKRDMFRAPNVESLAAIIRAYTGGRDED